MNMRQILGESGRTMSNMDFQKLKNMLGPPPLGPGPSIPNISMSDNEPRFAERPPFSQIFTIENDIQNKYREYEMAVRNNELLRAQNLINEIDQLEQQKIMIQNQAASPMSNRDMEITNILESISQ